MADRMRLGLVCVPHGPYGKYWVVLSGCSRPTGRDDAPIFQNIANHGLSLIFIETINCNVTCAVPGFHCLP